MAASISLSFMNKIFLRQIANRFRVSIHLASISTSSTSSAKTSDEGAPKLDQSLLDAVKDVASSLPGNKSQTEADLLSELLKNVSETRPSSKHSPHRPLFDERLEDQSVVSQLLSEAGQELQQGRHDYRYEWSRESADYRRTGEMGRPEKVGLFDAEPLNIFGDVSATECPESGARLDTGHSLWDIVEAETLAQLQKQGPSNEFEEMIEWTEAGKMWHFPIDNEQGWEETKVPFNEHVLLDDLIKDSPKTGPVRHFMDLVVVGLSKNPYITVKDKREHIEWFRAYFADKQAVLDELT